MHCQIRYLEFIRYQPKTNVAQHWTDVVSSLEPHHSQATVGFPQFRLKRSFAPGALKTLPFYGQHLGKISRSHGFNTEPLSNIFLKPEI
jgi:hypothetical protein